MILILNFGESLGSYVLSNFIFSIFRIENIFNKFRCKNEKYIYFNKLCYYADCTNMKQKYIYFINSLREKHEILVDL